jgi:multidrug efflux pump subunit AcrB
MTDEADTDARQVPGRGRIPLALGAGVAVVLLLGVALAWRADERTNKVALIVRPKPVTIVRARASSYRPSRLYVGTLQPWVQANVGPQLISAYVDTVLVRPGATVKRGDVLATLDCRDASASTKAIAARARAIDAHQKAIADEASRTQGLLSGGFVSPNEAEQKNSQSVSEEAQLEAEKATLAKSSLQVSDCVLRAPFSGEVAQRFIDPGAFVRPGSLTTMAVLLPVLLLSGLARRLFAPLALTVAVAMIASYLVSMSVTPVACRYFLKHVHRGGLSKRVEGSIDGLADAYARTLGRLLPHRRAVIVASIALVLASGLGASRLPSTFFPEIDESMDTIYVRFAPGIALEQATAQIAEMGRTLSRELPAGSVQMVIANLGTPQNARSAIVSPNVGPHTGFLQLAFSDPESRALSQAELAARARDILTRAFPGVETLQAPGGLVASVFSNGAIAPIAVEVRGDSLEKLDADARAIAEVARTVPGLRDVRTSLQLDYPEIRVETDREKAGLVGVSLRDAAQTTLEATLGNINTPSVWIDSANGQSYYVVTSYDGRRVADTEALAELPVRVSDSGQAVSLGAYGKIRRSLGPIAVERNQLARAAHVLMQTEGRDIGSVARDLERALAADPRTRGIRFDFVGQVQLMRTTFSGLGLALGLAVMVVFMIMASQFKSLRLPFVMLFTIPVALVGIVLALMAAGQGFSITALMGILMVIGIAVSNGILLVDDANRRFNEGADKVAAVVAAARSRFVPIAMTSLATIIGLLPTALGLDRGSEANQPLALAVVGGLTSSTILSLFLVPVMFVLMGERTREANG